MKKKRQRAILNFILKKGSVELNELTEEFPEVSKVTLRRDLSALEDEGHIIRTFGGARAAPQESLVDEFSQRVAQNYEAKEAIARKALELFDGRGTVFFDAGSTCLLLSRQLQEGPFSVVTNALNIALELNEKSIASVNILGGTVGQDTLSVTGRRALRCLEDLNIDLAFLGTSGLSVESGFTNASYPECDIKQMVISKCSTAVVLLDSSKFGLNLPFPFAQPREVDCIVTERMPPPELGKKLKAEGTEVLVADGGMDG